MEKSLVICSKKFWASQNISYIDRNLRPKACSFNKKETLAQMFSCEFCEISKNTFFNRTPPVAASISRCFNVSLIVFTTLLSFTLMQGILEIECQVVINSATTFHGSRCLQIFFERGVVENIVIFTGKQVTLFPVIAPNTNIPVKNKKKICITLEK